ncbi:MAG: alpha-glucan family phosphorylase, partial [Bacteroidota bacterium]
LWKYGYYDQIRESDQRMQAAFTEKHYSFLEDTGIKIPVQIDGNPEVLVQVYRLPAEQFGTAPIYLMSTDIPENDHLSRTITHRLYDNNPATRVAQSIVLGIAGGELVDRLGGADVYHMNEGHALPLLFHLKEKLGDWEKVRSQVVFTTHTPEKAGNEERPLDFLNEMRFFKNPLKEAELRDLNQGQKMLNYTLTALRHTRLSNGVSKLHGEVSNHMWKGFSGVPHIISITNAQNQKYWMDADMEKAFEKRKLKTIARRKKEMKQELFKLIADQCGKWFDPQTLTIVWARRFAAYKRADLFFRDALRFRKLIQRSKKPVQIIWAGKPYPRDEAAVETFNQLVQYSQQEANCAVLTGYELEQSRLLKQGADIWLNTPRRTREASGTSGMTAAMNGALNFSIFDGWICEFVDHGQNGFMIPPLEATMPIEEQDQLDCKHMYDILEKEILPLY